MEISSPEIGNRYEGAADADQLDAGEAASIVQLLKGVLLELKLIRAALADGDVTTT